MPEWREHDAAWFEQRPLHCALCGRLIAKRYLHDEIEGEAAIFCGEGCAALYRDYWLPARGRGYRPPANVGELYAARMVK